MKYYFTLAIIIFIPILIFGQTIVSTEIESRNVVLEDFTGIYCSNCPAAHEVANEIKALYPEDFFIINHHTGSFAIPTNNYHPNFVTKYGATLAQRSKLIGYPAGTINRHSFPGFLMNDNEPTSTAQYKNSWKETTEIHLEEDSYVNLGVEANWDYVTNEITVHVEAYYTGNSLVSKNLMNIALLQDSTFAYQIGKGDNYNHSNRLVDFITPWDGDVVFNTTSGSFYDKTFTYTLPEHYNDIQVDISNLKIVAFIVEDFNEVESASACNITYSNIPGHDSSISNILEINPNCSGTIIPKIKIRNNGGAEITSLDFEYKVDNSSIHSYHWTGSLKSYKEVVLTLPEISFDLKEINEFKVIIITSDDDNTNNQNSQIFIKETPIILNDEKITVEVQMKYYGSHITWELLGSSNEVIMFGGPYEDFDNTLHSKSVILESDNCYSFNIYDEKGNSLISQTDFYKIISSNVTIAMSNDFGYKERVGFKTGEDLTTLSKTSSIGDIHFSPNPTNSVINIKNAAGMSFEILDMVGMSHYSKKDITMEEIVDVSNFRKGIYIVRLSSEKTRKTFKIMIMN